MIYVMGGGKRKKKTSQLESVKIVFNPDCDLLQSVLSLHMGYFHHNVYQSCTLVVIHIVQSSQPGVPLTSEHRLVHRCIPSAQPDLLASTQMALDEAAGPLGLIPFKSVSFHLLHSLPALYP